MLLANPTVWVHHPRAQLGDDISLFSEGALVLARFFPPSGLPRLLMLSGALLFPLV
jgi:hypothetical protein